MTFVATKFRARRAARAPSLALAQSLAQVVAVVVTGLLAVACGYRPVLGTGTDRHYHVALVENLVADAVVADEVLAGLREELARYGALLPNDGYPRVEVEVLRQDEEAEGVVAGSAGGTLSGGGGRAEQQPLARGLRRSVVGRARVRPSPQDEPEGDTADVRVVDVLSNEDAKGGEGTGTGVSAAFFSGADLSRVAARRLGRRLARRVLGLPGPQDEGVGVEP